MPMKSRTSIKVYEEGGEELPLGRDLAITIESHGTTHNYVVLEVGTRKLTVVGDDLKRAIENAQNVRH